MSSVVPDDAPRPRLCQVKKWATFSGYGFNLHAEKGRAGQFIGKVDDNSPAWFAGLREGDRIVEVNGTNIGNENHQQVVQRIKAVDGSTKLLVVDNEADSYYKELKIVIRGDMPNVHSQVSPDEEPRGDAHPVLNAVKNEITEPSHKPRLCRMKIWTDFAGYGFNLHADKNKPGQYIGKVDDDSPAQLAGIREGDRILAVNGHVVGDQTHAWVVTQVKSDPAQARLLVVDPEADEYFKNNATDVKEDMSYVIVISCPDRSPASARAAEPEVAKKVAAAAVVVNGEASHRARLVHLKIWPDYDGYGFNMHCIKGRTGEFIGKVEDNSPSSAAGLREGDRLIEVNGDNIESENHVEVVQKIKTFPRETRLLVVDAECDAFFQKRGVVPTSGMADVLHLTCPDHSPAAANGSALAQVEVNNHAVEDVRIDPEVTNGDFDHTEDNELNEQYEYEREEVEHPVVAAAVAEAIAEERHEDEREADEIADSILASVAEADREPEPRSDHTVVVVAKLAAETGEDERRSSPEPEREEFRDEEISGFREERHEEISEVREEYREEVSEVRKEYREEISEEREERREEHEIAINDYEDVKDALPAGIVRANDIGEDHEYSEPVQDVIYTEVDKDEPAYAQVDRSRHSKVVSEVVYEEPNRDHEAPAAAVVVVKTSSPAAPVRQVSAEPVRIGGLEFPVSVAEARERVSQRRKQDPRKSQMSAKDKYDLFQKL